MDEEGNYLTDEDSNYIVVEQYNLETIVPGAENETLNTGSNNFSMGSDTFVDFSVKDPFSEGKI
jgi:hypothetical protein